LYFAKTGVIFFRIISGEKEMMFLLRRLRRMMTPQEKFRLLLIVLLMTLAALAEVIGTGLLIPLVAVLVDADLLEQNVYLNFLYRHAPVSGHHAFMLWSALLAALAFLFKNVYIGWVIHLQAKFVYERHAAWSDRVFANLLKTGYPYHLEHSSAELNAKLNRVVWVCDGILLPLLLILSDSLAIAALTGVMLFLIPGTALSAIAMMGVAAVLFYLPFRRCNRALSEASLALDKKLSAVRLDSLRGVKDIKAAAREDFFIAMHRKPLRSWQTVRQRLYWLGQLPRLGLETLTVVLAMGIFAAMVACRWPVATIALVFGLLTAVMLRVLPALSRIHYNLTLLRQVEAPFREFCDDLLKIAPEVTRDAPGRPYRLEKTLEIRDLSFGYQDDRMIFEHWNLTIPAHSCTALVGPTGGGKTTLADLVLGLLAPRQGVILADGRDIREDLARWRQITAYVPQSVCLLDDTIRANVAFGVPREEVDDAAVLAALTDARLADTVAALPDGLDTLVGDNGAALSGGQRQRLGIARALYRKPELLILDEATSALDQTTESEVVAALEHLRGKLTMLVIAHRLSTIESCDRKITVGMEK